MALSYDQRKKSYEWMDDTQKQQYNDLLGKKGDDYIGNQYMKQYQQASQPQQTTNTQQQTNNAANFNNQNGTNWQNQTQTPTIQKTETQNKYVNPDLDTSKFWETTWQVSVKEWTAQQTGKPDYQLDSEARMQEITKNLNAYRQNNPEFFKDRNTFNTMFHYNDRDESQKALLDTYWKKKEDINKVSTYTSWESVNNSMKNWEITTDQLNLLKEYNPEAYQKWQQLQEDEVMKRIVNDIVPKTVEEISWKINSMIEALGIQAQDALDIEWIYNDTMAKVWAYQTLEDCNRTVKQIEEVINKKTAIMNRYASSTWGTVSDALAAARMAKAIAPYNEQLQGLQYQYQDYSNLYSQKTATAYQAANVRAMQAQENQRIWQQKCSALWFATSALSYRTPEEQAQLDIQKQQALNESNLLYQSRLQDLNRYNTYATAKLQSQLQNELTDLSVEDEQQLKANLNNVLSDYYKNYWDIIQRSQPQAVEDIIAYAKKNGISVAQALSENFIKPLQNKKEYKMKVAQDYWMDKYQQQYSYTIDENWNVVIKASWFGEIPDSAFATRASRQNAYSDIYDESMDWASYIQNLSWCIKDWSYGGQCGAFVNDVLVAWDNNKVFGDSLQSKIDSCNVKKSEWPQVWYAAVFDLWYVSKSDWINHGHVGIVTSVNNDWSIDVLESNGQSDETIHVKRYSKEDVAKTVKGYYKPNNYDISRDLWGWDMTTYNSLKRKFAQNGNWNENWYIESLSRDFESYLEKWKDAITDSQWKSLKEDYGMDEKDFREMAQIYAKTWLKKKWVAQAETALKSALQLQDMLNNWKTLWIKDNPQWWLIDWALQIVPRSDAGEAKAQYDTLMSQLALDALFTAKDNWATFGAMSQWEWDILKAWATNLKWNSSNWLFEKNLNNLISELTNAVSSGWWTLPQWVYNTDI